MKSSTPLKIFINTCRIPTGHNYFGNTNNLMIYPCATTGSANYYDPQSLRCFCTNLVLIGAQQCQVRAMSPDLSGGAGDIEKLHQCAHSDLKALRLSTQISKLPDSCQDPDSSSNSGSAQYSPKCAKIRHNKSHNTLNVPVALRP